MTYEQEDRLFLALVFAGLVALVIAIMAGAVWLDSASCNAKFEGSNLEHRWSVLGGCRVKDPQQGWVPAENYRVF